MATAPKPIKQKNLPASLTTLYTLTTSGSVISAILVSLDFTNTTTSDVTVDVAVITGGNTDYLAKGLNVPANATASWRGLLTMNVNADLIQALASVATSIDVVGTVMESSV